MDWIFGIISFPAIISGLALIIKMRSLKHELHTEDAVIRMIKIREITEKKRHEVHQEQAAEVEM